MLGATTITTTIKPKSTHQHQRRKINLKKIKIKTNKSFRKETKEKRGLSLGWRRRRSRREWEIDCYTLDFLLLLLLFLGRVARATLWLDLIPTHRAYFHRKENQIETDPYMRKRVDRLFKSCPLFLRARAMRYHCRPSPFTASARYVAVYFLVLGKCVRVIQQCFSCLFVVVAVVAFTIPYLARPEPRPASRAESQQRME